MCRDISVWLPRNGQYHRMITTTKTTSDISALLYDELMSDKLDGDPLKILWKVSGVLSASVDRLTEIPIVEIIRKSTDYVYGK